jgi:hypothetical protein
MTSAPSEKKVGQRIKCVNTLQDKNRVGGAVAVDVDFKRTAIGMVNEMRLIGDTSQGPGADIGQVQGREIQHILARVEIKDYIVALRAKVGGGVEDEGVIPRATRQLVRACASDQIVISGSTGDGIIAGPTIQTVIAGAAIQRIVPDATVFAVISITAQKIVIASAAGKVIATQPTRQRVLAEVAGHGVIASAACNVVIPLTCRDIVVPIAAFDVVIS